MSPIPPRRHGHGVVVTAVVALACTLAPSVLADPVDQSDIDRSKASERSTSTSIASLETRLAQESSNLEDAQIKAQVANEDYLTAVDELNTATKDAQTAQTNADAAVSSTAAARSDLGSIVVQTYQESGNPLDPLTPYLTSESLADLADADVALTRAGEKNNAKVQNVEALEAVATSMQTIADQKVKAKSDAEAAANDAQNAVTTTRTNRQNLIVQLAAQRNTTVELETKYQNQVEAERKAREEAAAQAAAKAASEKAAADLAQKQAEQAAAQPQESAPAPQEQSSQPSPSPQSSAQEPATTSQPEPEAAEEEEAAPAPAPAPEPAPAPSHSGSAASTAINAAMGYLGTPYVWAGESAAGLDCSGFTMVSYAAAGVELTHSSRVQYGEGSLVPLDAAQPGDLVFWSSDGSQSGIYHVAIYLGDDTMIEAPTFGMTVRVTSMRYSGVMPYAVRL